MNTYHSELLSTYQRIHQNNQLHSPHPQQELNEPITYCRAVWTLGRWNHTENMKHIILLLHLLENEGVIYDTDSMSGGELHWTLFQFNTFPVTESEFTEEEHTNDVRQIQHILASFPSFHVRFRGISRTKHGLILNGYPSTHVNRIRDQIRQVIPRRNEPHPQDICHATLFRFHKSPSSFANQMIDRILREYGDEELTTMYPDKWEYGFGSWLQKNRKVITTWKSHPKWILHRGLFNGPDSLLENKEENILARLEEGWDIELDVWYIDSQWWIGHDGPQSILQHRELLTHPNCWVHCKNLEALCFIPMDSHHFVHDRDVATLTSKQVIWYNINHFVKSDNQSTVIVLPEKSTLSQETIWEATAVCSDYLPFHFIEKSLS